MRHTVEPEPDRVQLGASPAQPSDEGLQSWLFGSYARMASRRPAPIARFTGTILLQFLLNLALYDLLILAPAAVTVGACTLLALVLAVRVYFGWLGRAAAGWKVAMIAALALNVLLVAFFRLGRMG